MEHLINIYVTSWEWLEDRRGKTEALRERGYVETKRIWTFFSQGAVGGAIAYFLLLAGYAASHQNGLNIILCGVMPLMLAVGAAGGAFVSVFIWLTGVIFKRRLNAIARTLVVAGVSMLFGAGFTYFNHSSADNELPLLWTLILAAVAYTPIVLMTGTKIRPGHLIVLGAGERSKQYNFGNWLTFPAGILLRSLSIFGLFEALMMLAIWISARPTDWLGEANSGTLGAIVVAILYFLLSSYFSIATPRKAYVLPTAILVNLQLLVLLGYLSEFNSDNALYGFYALVGLLCLWAVYTLGRLLAPEAVSRVVDSNQKYGVVKQPLPRKNCTVAL